MSIHAPRLVRLFTPTYAAHINAQIVHHWGKTSQTVDSNKLASIMAKPLEASLNNPTSSAAALGAIISYGMITGV